MSIYNYEDDWGRALAMETFDNLPPSVREMLRENANEYNLPDHILKIIMDTEERVSDGV